MSRPPVVAAWGAGVDSTAMIVEMVDRGDPIDMVFALAPGFNVDHWRDAHEGADASVVPVPGLFTGPAGSRAMP